MSSNEAFEPFGRVIELVREELTLLGVSAKELTENPEQLVAFLQGPRLHARLAFLDEYLAEPDES